IILLFKSDNFLSKNGKIAVVLASSTLYIGYSGTLKVSLLKRYEIQYLISSDVDSTFSEQSAFKEILLIAQKKESTDENDSQTIFVSLKKQLTLQNAKQIAKKDKMHEWYV
ncbi:MAG: N-6 DNA methylase, partial [Nitrososphaeraceae archaeon]